MFVFRVSSVCVKAVTVKHVKQLIFIKQVQHNHIDLIGIYADQLKTHLYDEALGQNEAL